MFQKATRKQAKLRLGISGPSGSGKTYTALALAVPLAGDKRIAVVDSEEGSASLYADVFDFDAMTIAPPYHPQKFIDAIREAAKAGYGVVILDSITHAWAGPGGVLSIVDDETKRQKTPNSYTAWKVGSKVQDDFIAAIKAAQIHVIFTMRSKTEYQQADKKVTKVGMAPVQRDGMDYEADIMLEMDVEHCGVITKSRAFALADRVIRMPGMELGTEIRAWLDQGDAPPPPPPAPAPPPPHRWTDTERAAFCAKLGEMGLAYGDVAAWCESLKRERPSGMQADQRGKLLTALSNGQRATFDAWIGKRKASTCPRCGVLHPDLAGEMTEASGCPDCAPPATTEPKDDGSAAFFAPAGDELKL